MLQESIRYRLGELKGAPLHLRAEHFLRSLIEKAEFANGALLPPETSLASRLGISRGTMRGAIQRLVQDGLLERKAGVGTRVRSRKQSSGAGAWSSFTREMGRRGIAIENFTEEARMARAPAPASRELRVPRGQVLLMLERVRGWDGIPVGHFLSCFPPRLGLDPSVRFDRPLYDIIEEKCSVVADRSEEELTAVAADLPLAKALKLPLGQPLLKRSRTVYDTGGRPMEYAVIHYRCDHFALTLNLTRENP